MSDLTQLKVTVSEEVGVGREVLAGRWFTLTEAPVKILSLINAFGFAEGWVANQPRLCSGMA